MAATVTELLLARSNDETPAITYRGRTWTWREHLAEARRVAAAILSLADPARPIHVGTLLGNTPEMLTALAAGALGGYVTVGINSTRRGAALADDLRRADVQILITDAEHHALLDGLDLDGVTVLDTSSARWARLLAGAAALTPHRVPEATDTFMLIFTSGTSGNPKPVRLAHMMVPFAGPPLVDRFGIGPDDVCYLAMPLFHSAAILGGYCVALVSGAAMAPAEFSASRFLADQPDLSPKACPPYVRLARDLPTTATNKILKRALVREGATPGDGTLWARAPRSTTYDISDAHAGSAGVDG